MAYFSFFWYIVSHCKIFSSWVITIWKCKYQFGTPCTIGCVLETTERHVPFLIKYYRMFSKNYRMHLALSAQMLHDVPLETTECKGHKSGLELFLIEFNACSFSLLLLVHRMQNLQGRYAPMRGFQNCEKQILVKMWQSS